MELCDGIYLVGCGETGVSDRYDCHVYLVDCGDAAFVVDAGAGRAPERIFANIRRRMPLSKVAAVLLTHTHADHSAGTTAFREAGIKVFAPAAEMRMMRERPEEALEAFRLAKNDGAYPEEYEYPFIEVDGVVNDGEALRIGDAEVKALHFGGHSEGHLCYFVERGGKRVLFSGDFVFANGRLGLLNCPGSDLASYRRDIGKAAALGIDALLPGHRMFAVGDGQRHLDMAVASLSKAMIPGTF